MTTNPSEALVAQLAADRPRFRRLGIALHCAILPVDYVALGPALDRLIATHRPTAVLHIGVASRRRHVSVEMRAVNRVSLLKPDASGSLPIRACLVTGAPQQRRATYAAVPINTAIRRLRVTSKLSIDAGTYVCNATLFATLGRAGLDQVGFIHIPRPATQNGVSFKGGPRRDALVRAVHAALFVMARPLHSPAGPVAPRQPQPGAERDDRERRSHVPVADYQAA